MEAGIPYVYIVEVKAGERSGGQVFAEQAKGPSPVLSTFVRS